MGSVISRPVCISTGVLYPTYASCKALKSPKGDDEKQWLTYWVVYSLTTSVETVTDKIVSWVPGYYFMKMFLLLWMMLPRTKGSIVLYERFIYPFLQKYEHVLDKRLIQLRDAITLYVQKLKARSAKTVKKGIKSLKDGTFNEFLDRTIDTTPKNDGPTLKVDDDNKTSPP